MIYKIDVVIIYLFNGKIFVVIGILDDFLRIEVSDIIEKLGGKVSGFVFKKIDYVLVGKEVGFKFIKVLELGIEVMDEVIFKVKINE